MMRHLLPLALLLATAGCTDRADDVGKHDSVAAVHGHDTAANHTAPANSPRDTTKPSPPDNSSIRWDADSIPIRTADGKAARYGLESGRVTMRYSGDAKGDRTVIWDGWGARERRETFRQPDPETKPAGFDHSIFITNGEDQTYVSIMQKKAQHRRAPDAEHYLSSPQATSRSFGGVLVDATGAEQLADTTILGRRCHVYRRTRNDMTTTLAMWRGIVLREEVTNPKQDLRFVLEATEINTKVSTSDATFAVPNTFPIEEK